MKDDFLGAFFSFSLRWPGGFLLFTLFGKGQTVILD